MSNGPISLSDNNDYGSVSFPHILTKSLPLDESGYSPDGSTPCSTDSPHTPLEPSNQNTSNDPVLRVRSESFHMSDSLADEVSGRFLTDKQYSPRHKPGLDLHYVLLTVGLIYIPFLAKGYGNEETRDHEVFHSIYLSAAHLNYRQTTQPLAQDQDFASRSP